MDGILGDLRFSLRSLARRPRLAATVLVTFALGIGANSAVFSVVDAVLLRSLPYRAPGRLAMVWDVNAARGLDRSRMPPARFTALAGPGLPFEEVAACVTAKLDLSVSGEPSEVQADRVTPGFFRLLGVRMVTGRGFLPGEGKPGGDRVAVLSERLWRSRFGGDATLVGRTMSLNGEPREVVGIAPLGLAPFEGTDVWIPLTPEGWQSRVARSFTVVTRLRGGTSYGAAQTDLDLLARRLAEAFPDTDQGWSLRLVPLQDEVVSGVRTGLLVLWGAVAFVLLIACVNVAAILLSRGVARRRELAVRAAMGASRARLARLALVESLVLAVAGGGLGLGLAVWGSRLLVRWAPVALPRSSEAGVDGRVLAFTLLASGAAGVLAGLIPALFSLRLDVGGMLKDSGEQGGVARGQQRWLQGMVMAEIALSLVLLAGAGLLTKSFVELLQVDLGLRPDGVLTFRVSPPRSRYPDRAGWTRLYGEILDRLQAFPESRSVGAVSQLPLGGGSSEFRFLIEGRPETATADLPTAEYRIVTPGYFATLGIPLLAGEPLGARNSDAVLVNRALARRYWPAGNPVGQRLSVDGAGGPWLTVRGVVGDVRHFGPGEEARPEIYRSYESDPWPALTWVVRTGGDPRTAIPAVRSAVRQVDPQLPLADLRTLDDALSDALARPRFTTVLLGIFAVLALLLAAVGIYGTMAYSVLQRTREIGIRMSLGARPGDVAALILGRACRLSLGGLILGLGLSCLLTGALRHLLFQVRPTDPAVFGGVALLALALALLAAGLPALRASRVDPGVALRQTGDLGR